MGANVPQGMGVPKCIGARGSTLHVDSRCRGCPKEPSRLESGPERPGYRTCQGKIETPTADTSRFTLTWPSVSCS